MDRITIKPTRVRQSDGSDNFDVVIDQGGSVIRLGVIGGLFHAEEVAKKLAEIINDNAVEVAEVV